MGTIGIAATTSLADRMSRVRPDLLFVDAPVSGSKGPAEAGQLLILASGPAAGWASTQPPWRPVMAAMTSAPPV